MVASTARNRLVRMSQRSRNLPRRSCLSTPGSSDRFLAKAPTATADFSFLDLEDSVAPNEKVVFTFGWDEPDHPIPAGSTEVEITLVPDGDKTIVRLTHRGLPEDAVADHTGGWSHYLARLETAATGGDPGPDTMS